MSSPLAFHSKKAFVLSVYTKIRSGEKYKVSYIKNWTDFLENTK